MLGAPPSVVEGLAPGVGDWSSVSFPFLRRRRPEGPGDGYILYSCNLTDHVTRKSRDSVCGVEKVQFALLRKIGKEKLGRYRSWPAQYCTRVLVQYSLGKLLSLNFPTPLFSFLFRKVEMGFNTTTQHKSHDHPWPLNLELHKCAGMAPREIKHNGWHPTAIKRTTGGALLHLSKITIPVEYLTLCSIRSTCAWSMAGNTTSRLAPTAGQHPTAFFTPAAGTLLEFHEYTDSGISAKPTTPKTDQSTSSLMGNTIKRSWARRLMTMQGTSWYGEFSHWYYPIWYFWFCLWYYFFCFCFWFGFLFAMGYFLNAAVVP